MRTADSATGPGFRYQSLSKSGPGAETGSPRRAVRKTPSRRSCQSGTAFPLITARRAKEILREVERAVIGWRKLGRALGMTARDLEAFAEAFEHPEWEVARKAAR